MNADDVGSFFSRWSRRKLEETGQRPKEESAQPEAEARTWSPPSPRELDSPPQEGEPAPLPPVESLNAESDFKPFMAPGVKADVKQAALKQLFKDPHFNVMDGLDTYIEDYGVPDPIPSEMMKKLYQARQHLFTDEEKAEADRADALQAEAAAKEALAEVPEEYREIEKADAPAAPGEASSPDAKA